MEFNALNPSKKRPRLARSTYTINEKLLKHTHMQNTRYHFTLAGIVGRGLIGWCWKPPDQREGWQEKSELKWIVNLVASFTIVDCVYKNKWTKWSSSQSTTRECFNVFTEQKRKTKCKSQKLNNVKMEAYPRKTKLKGFTVRACLES